ncbi:transposable element Tcb2 transposase [Trichonephila clavipes]|nr:transposable element Tcb2 transposase [Trichonephila clavipes]
MTGHIYRDVILEQHERLFRGAMGAEFLFMDDNTLPHHVNIVDKCLQSEDITRMNWPAYSPELESNRARAGYSWPTNCSPSTPSHLSTGTSEDIA